MTFVEADDCLVLNTTLLYSGMEGNHLQCSKVVGVLRWLGWVIRPR